MSGRVKRNAIVAAFALIGVAVLAYLYLSEPAGSPAELAQALGGGEVIAALRDSRDVIAYHIRSDNSGPTSRRAEPLDYQIIDGPRTVSPIQASELKSALLDPDSYLWGSTKECIFDPGLRVSFGHASDVIDVLFCFSCDELSVYRNRRLVGAKDFDPSRAKFVAFAKRVFSTDQIIQALSERRTRGS